MLTESSREVMPRALTAAEFSEESLSDILGKSKTIFGRVRSYHIKFHGSQPIQTSMNLYLDDETAIEEKSIRDLLADIDTMLSNTIKLLDEII